MILCDFRINETKTGDNDVFMKLKTAALVAACIVGGQAHAVQLSFDLSGLTDAFTGAGVTGGFDFDTDDLSFGAIDIGGISASYGAGSGVFRPGLEVGGFGEFDDGLFQFTSEDISFLFSPTGLDLDDPGLAAGEMRTLADIIALEGMVNDDFQLADPFAATSSLLTGDVVVTRQDDQVAPIPLPAGLPLLLAGLGGLALIRRRVGA